MAVEYICEQRFRICLRFVFVSLRLVLCSSSFRGLLHISTYICLCVIVVVSLVSFCLTVCLSDLQCICNCFFVLSCIAIGLYLPHIYVRYAPGCPYACPSVRWYVWPPVSITAILIIILLVITVIPIMTMSIVIMNIHRCSGWIKPVL